ncbi:helix-turn-helix domain-containing protein [Sphingobacterium psychroaquaticum]|uniref:Helix-turn-helix domain-containing protein n=1 Tax=Sphingobacterium psychroaquaticum TaxID=561061 RepID=A0A1X7IKW3_9SPHI|nr:helix-turn-helix transcriptional regulator [Sphingobacterium psychroaquaticum]SMG15613.1 Helix-turn-helix domain-containing protein [Sphingobacterium psychroaquaticum]
MEFKSFGIKVRGLRKKKGLLLRQIAAALEMDTALISKIERGERKANREQVIKLAEILNVEVEELLVIWLSDKIVDMLEKEPLAYKALKNSEKRIKNKY